MLIEAVRVRNFRSIVSETLRCDELTAIVGANGSGKSAFLRALDLFYSSGSQIDIDDFYNRDHTSEISIGVTFGSLSKDAAELFAKYLQDSTLTVEKVIRIDTGKPAATYHGSSLQCPDFRAIRDNLHIGDRGKASREAYEELGAKAEFGTLPKWPSKLNAVDDLLKAWEESNPDKCVRERDDGRFFGFNQVGEGYLGRFTRFLFIPAVRDAFADAAEGRGSALSMLMDMVVRSVLANKESVKKLRADTQTAYEEIMNPETLTELKELSGKLSGTLRTYAPNASVDLKWLPLDQIQIGMPRADIRLVEDNFATTVQRTGHGLQRAFILTMLQHLAMARAVPQTPPTEAGGIAPGEQTQPAISEPALLPNLVLAIEEPELYQHPNRQRHLSKILLQLATGKTPGVAETTQVIYATHSPLFVGLDRFSQLRLLRKVATGDRKPKSTKVVDATLDSIAEKLWEANGKRVAKYTGEQLSHRLHAMMTPMINEGFFADAVVLVEGEDDYAAITGMAAAMNIDLEGRGLSIIPVGGKSSLDRPALIFRAFGIPVYLLWDGDGGKGTTAGKCEACGKLRDGKPDPADNHRLLRIVGKQEEDWPEQHEKTHCCFAKDLESELREDIGENLFDQLLSDCQVEFGIPKRKHAIKNPNIIGEIIIRAEKKGATSKSLRGIVENIVALVPGTAVVPN